MSGGIIGNLKFEKKKKMIKATVINPSGYKRFIGSTYHTSRGIRTPENTNNGLPNRLGKYSSTPAHGNNSPNPVGTPIVYNVGRSYRDIETKRKYRTSSGNVRFCNIY